MKEITLIARIPIFMLIIFVLVSPIQAALESDKKPNKIIVFKVIESDFVTFL